MKFRPVWTSQSRDFKTPRSELISLISWEIHRSLSARRSAWVGVSSQFLSRSRSIVYSCLDGVLLVSFELGRIPGLRGWAEYVGVQKLKVLTTSGRDAGSLPPAHRRRLDPAKPGNSGGIAQGDNQLRIGVQGVGHGS